MHGILSWIVSVYAALSVLTVDFIEGRSAFNIRYIFILL